MNLLKSSNNVKDPNSAIDGKHYMINSKNFSTKDQNVYFKAAKK